MLSVDRFEGEFVVCIDENGRTINISVSEMPLGIKEGDIVKKENRIYIIDDEKTRFKREEIKKLQSSLWE